MSLSSQTTLISPTTKPAHPHLHRRGSAHHAHPRRRPSHGHARRGSEGDGGRRALAAGLAMHTLDTGKKKKPAEQRPQNQHTSRSDTNLPHLSRTNSMMSNTSHASQTSNTSTVSRPGAKPRRSREQVQILDEQGREIDPNEEEWESGEEAKRGKKPSKKKDRTNASALATSAAMRRTVSDSTANKQEQVGDEGGDHRPPLTQRTTGFAGAVQPLDPQIAAEMPSVEPPVIQNPIKRVASSKSLVGPISAMTSVENTPDSGIITEAPKSEQERLRKAQENSFLSSGLPRDHPEPKDESPSYPFPKMPSPEEPPKPPSPPRPESPLRKEDGQHRERQASSLSGSNGTRSRQVSNRNAPSLRHRYSNSSLRSIQSLRAPPHPLNSPTGYRTVRNSTAAYDSPSKNSTDEKRTRVPSMHQPPVPDPQVNFEVAQGKGWDQIPEEGALGSGTSAAGTSRSQSQQPAQPQSHRRSSVASTRSLRSIFAGTLAPPPAPASPQNSKRLTAHEAASAAAKRPTTNNPVLYHHSLGHPSSAAESCFLISRFLPEKKLQRPSWEVDPDLTEEERAQDPGAKLTNGEYRTAHETLVHTFRHLGSGVQTQKRSLSRNQSYGILPSSLTLSSVAAATGVASHIAQNGVAGASNGVASNGLGSVKGKDGSRFELSNGGSNGMSPFEMSVQRVLNQRPGRVAL
ncbi:hypothetical protein I350_03697 [Cryptococcus amylolentus CBS 6273]|uniref:Uncharacterized protein n=1 Tax=Cryptococcus amylolentus CBS 6273 TaxID=1296118 RepID=A0A1E3K5H7_9TREE|nr:hypothetical protein I350_03697 [Cryptococcus amylolentus CBS 6273]